MRRILSLSVFLLVSFLLLGVPEAFSQSCPTGYSLVQASKIQGLGGALLPSGTMTVTAVDANRQNINFGAPGGGAVIKASLKAAVVNGAVSTALCVPRSDLASVYVRYHFVVVDNSSVGTHATVIDVNDVPITTDVFSLDSYSFPANAYANPPNEFTSGNVNGDLHVTGTLYAGTVNGATAQNAVHATTADTATTATNATTATTASYATTAGTAASATTATTAGTASTANTANTATALASAPTDCGSQAATGINADGSPKACISVSGGSTTLADAFGTQVVQSGGNASVITPAWGVKMFQYGDSITWGAQIGAPGTVNLPANRCAQSFGSLLASISGVLSPTCSTSTGNPISVLAVPGDTSADIFSRQIALTAGTKPSIAKHTMATVAIGTNDVAYGPGAGYQTIFQALTEAALAWIGTPAENTILAGQSGFVNNSGTNTNPFPNTVPSYGGASSGLTITQTLLAGTGNTTITQTSYGNPLYLFYIVGNTLTGSCNVSLDSVSQGSINSSVATVSNNASGNSSVEMLRMPALAGSHTTVISGCTGTTGILGQSTLPVLGFNNRPTVAVADVFPQNTSYTPVFSQATYGALRQGLAAGVQELQSDGLDIRYVQTSIALNSANTALYAADGTGPGGANSDVHFSATGHAAIAQLFYNSFVGSSGSGGGNFLPISGGSMTGPLGMNGPSVNVNFSPGTGSSGLAWGATALHQLNMLYFGTGNGALSGWMGLFDSTRSPVTFNWMTNQAGDICFGFPVSGGTPSSTTCPFYFSQSTSTMFAGGSPLSSIFLPLTGGTVTGNLTADSFTMAGGGHYQFAVGTYGFHSPSPGVIQCDGAVSGDGVCGLGVGPLVAQTSTVNQPTPTVPAGSVGTGNTVAAASNCNGGGTITGVAGCWVINVGGRVSYTPYF